MEAHLGELDPASLTHEEQRRHRWRVVATGHMELPIQQHRKSHVVGLDESPRLPATILRDRHDPMSVSTECLRETLQIRDREAAGGTVGLDERDEQGPARGGVLESPIGSVHPRE